METVMATAMKKTPRGAAMSAQARLDVMAARALQHHGENVLAAVGPFIREVSKDADLLACLVGEMTIRTAAVSLLLAATKMLEGGDRRACDVQTDAVPAGQQPDDEGGHLSHDVQVGVAPSSAPGRESVVPVTAHTRSRPDRRIAAAIAINQKIARTVLDSYRVRDGRSIGDVKWHEVERLRRDAGQEAAIFRQIQRQVNSAADDAKVRDLISADDLARFVQRAAEAVDVL